MSRHNPNPWRSVALVSGGAIGIATLTPGSGSAGSDPWCVVCGTFGGIDVVLNTLLFAPLGFALGRLGMQVRTGMGIVIAGTLLVELLQVFLVPGRDASLGDLITNSVGGSLGVLAGRHWAALLRPAPAVARAALAAWLVAWLALLGVLAMAWQPDAGPPPYTVQLGRPLGPLGSPFPGRIVDVRWDRTPLVRRARVDPSVVQRLQSGGARLTADVVPGGVPRTPSEIVNLSGGGDDDVISLEQRGTSLVMTSRTGADVLRLRRFAYVVRGAFPRDPAPSDTLRLTATYSPREVRLSATDRERTIEQRYTPALSHAWRLFTPWQTFIGDGRPWIDALFLALQVLPAAFWATIAWAPRRVMAATAVAAGQAVALVAVSVLAGLRSPAALDLGVIAVAASLGAALAVGVTGRSAAAAASTT